MGDFRVGGSPGLDPGGVPTANHWGKRCSGMAGYFEESGASVHLAARRGCVPVWGP